MSRPHTSSSSLLGVIITAVFTLVGAGGWALTAWLGPPALAQVTSQTAQTTATVTEVHATEKIVEKRDSNGHRYQTTERSCVARYSYTIDDQTYQRTSSQCSLRQGDTVPMHYQPGLPRNAALDVDRTTTADGVWGGYSASALFITIGLGMGVFNFRSSLAAGFRAAVRLGRRLFGPKPPAVEPDGDIAQVPQPDRWEQPNTAEAQTSIDPAQ